MVLRSSSQHFEAGRIVGRRIRPLRDLAETPEMRGLEHIFHGLRSERRRLLIAELLPTKYAYTPPEDTTHEQGKGRDQKGDN
jgi:hypothetical protein